MAYTSDLALVEQHSHNQLTKAWLNKEVVSLDRCIQPFPLGASFRRSSLYNC